MKMRLAIDLDNTIFDLAWLYKDICARHNVKYVSPTSWDIYESYPRAVADDLMTAFNSDAICHTPILNAKIPGILNALYTNPDYMVYYITERPNGRDIWQLNNAGIICDPENMINCKPKIDALKEYRVDLCFDDSPQIVQDCIDNNIDVVMISNQDTAYNHHLRGHVENYPDLITALSKRGITE